jgi:hypothetical protein
MDRLTFFVSLHGVYSAGLWKSVRGKYEEELAILSGRKGFESVYQEDVSVSRQMKRQRTPYGPPRQISMAV